MAKQIYAVLVGINNYNECPLEGCLNDIYAVENWLTDTYKYNGNLHIKRLTDNDADSLPTRNNIIAAFDYFAQADNEDICLFYFAGHGINIKAPKAFTEDAGTEAVQAILCLDWQRNVHGKGYIIDKELGFLIWKATLEKPGLQFIAITDCCHSGSATRDAATDVKVRSMDILEDSPDVTAYEGYHYVYNGIHAYEIAADGSITVQQAPHLHIAAAQDREVATELRLKENSAHRGAFSYVLLKLLTDSGGKISYLQLQEEACNKLQNLYFKEDKPYYVQHPKLNNYYQQSSCINKLFLSNEDLNVGEDSRVYYDKRYGWCINAGLLQGVSHGDEVAVKLNDGVEKSCNVQQSSLLFSGITPLNTTDVLSDMDQKKYYTGHVAAKRLLPFTDAKSKWQYIVNLKNPETEIEDFTINVLCATGYNGNNYTFEKGNTSKPNVLQYITSEGYTYKPAFKLSIENTGSTDLFFSFAYLDAGYNIIVDKSKVYPDYQIAGGKTQDTKRIKLENEDEQPTEEYLKIFVAANRPIPLDSLAQDAQSATRGLAPDDNGMEDWTTVTIGLQIAPKPR